MLPNIAKCCQKLPKDANFETLKLGYVRTYGRTGGLLELLSQLKRWGEVFLLSGFNAKVVWFLDFAVSELGPPIWLTSGLSDLPIFHWVRAFLICADRFLTQISTNQGKLQKVTQTGLCSESLLRRNPGHTIIIQSNIWRAFSNCKIFTKTQPELNSKELVLGYI